MKIYTIKATEEEKHLIDEALYYYQNKNNRKKNSIIKLAYYLATIKPHDNLEDIAKLS